MDREHIKGTAEKAKGAIKDTAGKVTADKKLQTEGKFDKVKGSAMFFRAIFALTSENGNSSMRIGITKPARF